MRRKRVKNYAYVKETIERRKQLVESFKVGKPCKRCEIVYPPVAMDFHHRDPKQKSFTIGRGVYRVSKARVLAEIVKCDIYCSNCHRIIEKELRRGVTGNSASQAS